MAGRFRLFALVSLALVACRSFTEVIVQTTDRFIRTIFETLAPSPRLNPALAYDGYAPHPAFAYPDPHVSRHEAGMAHRAAARGI